MIKQGARYYRDKYKSVSEATNLIVIDSTGKKTIYPSMTAGAKNLNIGRI